MVIKFFKSAFYKQCLFITLLFIAFSIDKTSAQTRVFFDEASKKYGLINQKTGKVVVEADNVFIQNIGSGYFAYTKTGKVTNEIVEGVFSGYRFKNVINAKYGIVDSLGHVQCLPVFTFVDAIGADGLFLASYDSINNVVIANIKGKQVSPKNYYIEKYPDYFNSTWEFSQMNKGYSGYQKSIPEQIIVSTRNIDSLEPNKLLLINNRGKKIKTPKFIGGHVDINGGAALYFKNQTWDYYFLGKKQNKQPIIKMVYKSLCDCYPETFYYLTTDRKLFAVNWKMRDDTAKINISFQLLDENVSDLEHVYYGKEEGSAIFLPLYTKKLNQKIKPVYNDKQNKLLPEYDSIKGKRIDYVNEVNYTGINFRKKGPQLFALKKDSKILYVTENNEVLVVLDFWDEKHFYNFEIKTQQIVKSEKQVKDSLESYISNFKADSIQQISEIDVSSNNSNETKKLSNLHRLQERYWIGYNDINKDGFAIIAEKDSFNKLGICDSNYNITCLPKYQNIVLGYNKSIFAAQSIENGKWGAIDANGNVVIEFKYNYIDQFHNGVAPYYSKLTYTIDSINRAGYINEKGEILVPDVYTEVMPVNSFGLARVYVGGKNRFEENPNDYIGHGMSYYGSDKGAWKILDVKKNKLTQNGDEIVHEFISDKRCGAYLKDTLPTYILMASADSLQPKYGYLVNNRCEPLRSDHGQAIERLKIDKLSSAFINKINCIEYEPVLSYTWDANGNEIIEESPINLFSLKKGKFLFKDSIKRIIIPSIYRDTPNNEFSLDYPYSLIQTKDSLI
ncbi:MAG: WG repeat-containing protein, partial [Sphingobacteriaceae bacterium]